MQSKKNITEWVETVRRNIKNNEYAEGDNLKRAKTVESVLSWVLEWR